MSAAMSNRATYFSEKKKKYQSMPYICQQPWKKESRTIVNTLMVEYQQAFLTRHYGYITNRNDSDEEDEDEETPPLPTQNNMGETANRSGVLRGAITPSINSIVTVDIHDDMPTPAAERIIAHATNTAVFSPLAKPVTPVIRVTAVPTRPNARALEMHTQVINTQGWSLNYELPKGQVIISEEELNELRQLAEITLRINAPIPPSVEPTVEPVIEPTVEHVQKKKHTLNYHSETVKVQGQDVTVQVPNGYMLTIKDKMTQIEKKAEMLKELIKNYQSGKYHGGSPYANVLLTIGLAAAPTIPYSTLSQVLPVLCMGTHLADAGLHTVSNFDLKKYVTSYPSDTFMRGKIYDTATMCTIQMAEFFHGKLVFLATDKGMIHMLKMCYTCFSCVSKCVTLLRFILWF